MTNEIFISQNTLKGLEYRSKKVIFEDKNPLPKNILKLKILTSEILREINKVFGETLENCLFCLELVTKLSEKGNQMSAEEVRNDENLFKKKLELIEISLKKILQKFPKYQYYGEYRERLLKVYYIIQKILKIIGH